MAIDWKSYKHDGLYDELTSAGREMEKISAPLMKHLSSLSDKEIQEHRTASDIAIRTMGISFTVYSEQNGSIDRAWPFDIIPRVIAKVEWNRIEEGLKQRVRALNSLIDDIYHNQKVIKDKIIPREILDNSKNFRPECVGVNPPLGIWAHICGSDLIRDEHGTVFVLEDNLRVPSGVSYMLENRLVMKRIFPELFEDYNILPLDDYTSQLYNCLAAISPRPLEQPEVVVMTPGIYNSAYFEHAYLAQQMGVELVQGTDLVVQDDDCVYMKTISGLERVDVIYRRIDDLFIDPDAFNPDSVIGVPGLMRAWIKGNVALANAPGTGVVDDKVIYAYMPKVIKYYLDEDPMIENVPTYVCFDKKDREYVIHNMDKLVIKPANESGGYGMLIGPNASKRERTAFAKLIKKDPRNYIAQPLIKLSTCPTLVKNHVEPRHIDLRPFILSGQDIFVTNGGLTRVALRKGSTIVNSSQGGGSKDTWIISAEGD